MSRDQDDTRSRVRARAEDRLDSWKQIAAYLRREVRTVQRWERSEELPVHRHVHDRRGTVFAFRSELDAWLAGRTESGAVALDATTARANGDPGSVAPCTARRWPRPSWMRLALLSLVALGMLAVSAQHMTENATRAKGERSRVLVLPFLVVGSEPVPDPIVHGLLEEVITHLSRIDPDHILVLGRTSALHYAGRGLSPTEIGDELDVSYLVEGSLTDSGDSLHATVRLVRAEGQEALWSETSSIRRASLLEDARAFASRIGDALRAEAPNGAAAPGAEAGSERVDPAAYDAWLRGRYRWHAGTEGGFRQSIPHFAHALEIEPDYVAAHVGLAHAHNMLGRYGLVPASEAFEAGRTSALRALELAPNDAEAHAALGLVHFYYDWDFERAAEEFRTAIELAPELAIAHHWYAHFLSAMGLHDEAIEQARITQELEPLWALVTADAAWFHFRARRFDEAIEACRRALDLEPDMQSPLGCLVMSLRQKGDVEGAWRVRYERLEREGALARYGFTPETSPEDGFAELARRGRDDVLSRIGTSYVAPYSLAFAEIDAGNVEGALDALERAVESKDRIALLAKVHPALDPLRDEPRFRAVLDRVGFPDDPAILLR